ncbi:hypothetical protein GCM10018779_56430 [Streptomyces griseocarneus]|nr:hypothetical protein GCM10018779_56430 [Streptomyces griseocarneus]
MFRGWGQPHPRTPAVPMNLGGEIAPLVLLQYEPQGGERTEPPLGEAVPQGDDFSGSGTYIGGETDT